jgi:elongator complex protein 3
MTHYEAGRYRPYAEDELLKILIDCMTSTPVYCRLSRVIRDIPGDDILAGSRVTNFRAIAETEMAKRGIGSRDIRAREIRGDTAPVDTLRLVVERYRTSVGDEAFLQFVTDSDRLAGFLRLSLPEDGAYIAELEASALIREVHVYGAAATIGERDERKAQHLGLGRRLIDRAAELAREHGFSKMAVISSVGTRDYYRKQGFSDGALYQHRAIR